MFEIELFICMKMDLALNKLSMLICHKPKQTNKQDLALNNPQELIWHKAQPNPTKPNLCWVVMGQLTAKCRCMESSMIKSFRSTSVPWVILELKSTGITCPTWNHIAKYFCNYFSYMNPTKLSFINIITQRCTRARESERERESETDRQTTSW